LSKTHSSLYIGSAVETLVVPEALRSMAPPVGAIGGIVEAAGDLWTVAFPLPFVGANGTIQFSRDASKDLQLTYAPTDLRVSYGKTPRPTRLVVVRLDDQERVDGGGTMATVSTTSQTIPIFPSSLYICLVMTHRVRMQRSVRRSFRAGSGRAFGLIERFYARSEDRAKRKALALCQKNGWHVYAEE
jgi:hypothetical protein